MGRYEIQDKNAKNNIGTDKNSEQNKRRKQNRKINSMTPQQKVKWIREGD